MKIVFLGNTKYSAIGEEIIHKKFPLSLVVTTTDRPSGRKRELKPTATKQFAIDNNIPVLETDNLDEKAISEIAEVKPDFIIVEDYGLILPESLLEIPRYAPLNIHHSLLPKYRGPSPAPSTILQGEKTSGVTIISMTELVDAGDILAQVKYELKTDETTHSLLTSLNKLGGELVLKVIEDYINGKQNPVAQNHKQASVTKRFIKQDGFVDLEKPPQPETFDRMVRAFFPWPTVWTQLDGKIIKFLPEGKIQPEGKKPMSIKEFLNGYPQTKELLEGLKL
ncbi:MAG: methionyl-tRNA formyltransferase [Candidatus Curtissbacteria bacterium]|nr:methionyl-tRNA formyltransferase [Candidatus Curtissbacteria bacterium]